MAETTCGRCGKYSHMTPHGGSIIEGVSSTHSRLENAFRCDRCKRLNIGALVTSNVPASYNIESVAIDFWSRAQPQNWHPKFVEGQEFSDVPQHVARPASEAHACHSISASMSAILMARSVIEAVAKDKGITVGNLYKKIDGLHEKGLINNFAKETAHTIRSFGNDMAHGDFTVEVDEADAARVLKFMDYILREIYQAPAELLELQESSAARKAQAPS